MGRALKAANKKIAEKVGFNKEQEERKKLDYEKYESLLEKKQAFDVQFSSCSPDGTFSTEADGLYIVMQGDSTVKHMPYFKPELRTVLLGYTFNVRVSSIDKENGRIYVESTKQARSEKSSIVREIITELDKGNYPVVWGKVTSVKDNVAFVDILGENILGRVDIFHWQKTFIRHLSAACSVGEYYQFQVTSTLHRKGMERLFLLEHRNLADNPWKHIPLDIVVPNAVVKIKCIELPEGKNYWWGTTAFAKGIEVMGNYPTTAKLANLRVVPDITYNCKVITIRVDEEDVKKNMFKVIPFSVVEEDKEKYEKYINLATSKEKIVIPTEQDENNTSGTGTVKDDNNSEKQS